MRRKNKGKIMRTTLQDIYWNYKIEIKINFQLDFLTSIANWKALCFVIVRVVHSARFCSA